jgi:hypothetical protein
MWVVLDCLGVSLALPAPVEEEKTLPPPPVVEGHVPRHVLRTFARKYPQCVRPTAPPPSIVSGTADVHRGKQAAAS